MRYVVILGQGTVALLAATGLLAGAAAQTRVDAIDQSVLRPYALRGAAPGVAAERTLPRTSEGAPQWRDSSALGGAVQVEAPRAAGDGSYTRPRIAFGVPSEWVRDWLNSAGFSAERCLLPMVRARARISSDGDPSGTVVLAARCSFR